MSAPAPSRLDAGQVLQGSFDETTGRLRTDATATVVSADIDVQLDANTDSVAIGDQTTGITAKVDATGHLSVKDEAVLAELQAQTAIMSGPQTLPTGAATAAKQDVGNVSLSSLDSKLPSPILGRVPVDTGLTQPLTDTQLRATPLDISVTNPITGFATETTLSSIDTKLDNLSSLSIGTIDGTPSGTQAVFVNNIRQQILASHDREQDITYADFGTKDQRITQVDYNSATFPGIIARKTIVYTLVSGRYRRDSINWSIQ